MKLISWNVNGIRAAMSKGLLEFINNEDPDIFCIQETKLSSADFSLELGGYHQYYFNAKRKGYSGTAIFSKKKPIDIKYGFGYEEYDDEGRSITVEYDSFYLVCVYVPNSQRELARLDFRRQFNSDFTDYLVTLSQNKDVVICGDLNVAHKEIDIKNPKSNLRNAGFTIEERTDFSFLLDKGFYDTFRHLYPDTIKYSWWSYMFKAREKDIGWRIDYFLCTKKLLDKIKEADIYTKVLGSDHAPILLEFKD